MAHEVPPLSGRLELEIGPYGAALGQAMSLADDGVLAEPQPSADLGRGEALLPERGQLLDEFRRPDRFHFFPPYPVA